MTQDPKRSGILTGGTWCADHNKLVERWPGEEDLVIILEEEIRGGGSACNLAIDIKRLSPELEVSTIGILGDDSDGHLLKQQAEAEGLNVTQLVNLDGKRTTFTDAFTAQDTGRRTHLFHPGVSNLLSPDHFDFSRSTAKIFHLGLPGLHATLDSPWQDDPNGWVTVLKMAQAAGMKTNLELCSLPAERLKALIVPCLQHLDYLIVNEFEIAAVAGRPIGHDQDSDVEACLSNAQTVLDQGAMDLVIVHFPTGAVAIARDGEQHVVPSVDMPAQRIAGTNGAGDAFASGALYGLHENWPLADTIRLAHASAAASMQHIGTTDALTSWQKCLDLADELGWRKPL